MRLAFIPSFSLHLLFFHGFQNAYDSSLGRLIISLVRPVIEPLRKLNLQFGGLDFTVWVAIILIQFIGVF